MFILYSTDDDRQLPTEELPCGAITPTYGMALYMSAGKLAVASYSNAAEYICVENNTASKTAGDPCKVVKIQKDQVWSTVAEASGYSAGSAYGVHTGGLTIKSSASYATQFVLNHVEGTDVRGRFVS